MTGDHIAAQLDAYRDTIALLQASLERDGEAIGAILNNTDMEAVLGILAGMFVSHLQQQLTDPEHFLDSFRQCVEARAAAGEPF